MWYVISFLAVVWLIYLYKKKTNSPKITISMQVDNNGWEEAKIQKTKSLQSLKKSFDKVENTQDAIAVAEKAVFDFINNHDCSVDDITNLFKAIKLPENLSKKELVLRKELNKHYKNRENNTSKAFSIYIAFKHAELQLSHHKEIWKNFLGLQKLQSNLKAEEYFEPLLRVLNPLKKHNM